MQIARMITPRGDQTPHTHHTHNKQGLSLPQCFRGVPRKLLAAPPHLLAPHVKTARKKRQWCGVCHTGLPQCCVALPRYRTCCLTAERVTRSPGCARPRSAGQTGRHRSGQAGSDCWLLSWSQTQLQQGRASHSCKCPHHPHRHASHRAASLPGARPRVRPHLAAVHVWRARLLRQRIV
jgi:hypothetical protein